MTSTEHDFSQFYAGETGEDIVSDAAEFVAEPLGPEPQEPERAAQEPDAGFIKPPDQTRTSKAYEKKARQTLNGVMRVAVAHPATVPDGAALIMYSPKLARAVGDLADADGRVRAAVDWITEGTENPWLSALAVTVPLALQIVRNHEPVLAPNPERGIRLPFTKRRFRFKWGIKLGGIRRFTNEPKHLESYVFDNPAIAAALAEMEITVARNVNGRKRG